VYPEQRSDKARNAHPPLPLPFTGIIRAEVLATMAAYLEAVRGDCADVVPYHAGPSNAYSPINAIAMPTKQAMAHSRKSPAKAAAVAVKTGIARTAQNA
jgi:hypothetical protein